MTVWKREMAGVYTLLIDPQFQVKSYCECTYSNCIMKWAVYLEDEPIDSMYFWSLNKAKEQAEALSELQVVK